ncbi:lectin c-type domain protein [Plakobranchus ocellatus]|uniref:Lectin c-type domain protein n=1 Tax=Plakobranchus ocellatus TaxID=259542 RepID=A0AAV4AVZ2_9GAST|nr:lectin c-type domain protein [Plakobranchus ocellatus]
MISIQVYSPGSLALVILMAFICREEATGQALQLTMDLSSRSSLYPSLNCSLDHSLISMDTVASLSISGPRPYSKKGDLEVLASISKWDTTPTLLNGLDDNIADVTGFFSSENNKSELVVSWKLPIQRLSQDYKCSAHGTDVEGETIASYEKITVDTQELLSVNACNEDKLDLLLSRIDDLITNSSSKVEENFKTQTTNMDRRLQNVESLLKKQGESIEKNLQPMGNLQQTGTDTNSFLLDLQKSVTRLQQTLDLQAFAIKRLEAHFTFDFSESFRGKNYFMSKTAATFNIARADATCVAYGGYLVELDDMEELKFVSSFVRQTGRGGHIFTGANDLAQEGIFVYYHSKKPVPTTLWIPGEPNNDRSGEDCVHIQDRLNDTPCGQKGRYVCESQ